MTILWRLVATLAAMLLVLAAPISFVHHSEVVASQTWQWAAFGHDNPQASAHAASPDTERGPPESDFNTTYGAVSRCSTGASVRPNESGPWVAVTYDVRKKRVQVTPASRTTGGHAQVVEAEFAVAHRAGVAAKGGDDLVDVWRTVGADEAADVARTGGYRVPAGGEGKYFFPTREQAENLGRMYSKKSWTGPQTLTRGQGPRSVIGRSEGLQPAGEGLAWFIRSGDVPSICNVVCIGPIG